MQQAGNQHEQVAELHEEMMAQREELTAAIEALEQNNNELVSTLDDLERINLELDQIVYRTNHDLRSPITAIEGITNLLRLEFSDPKLQPYIGHIERNIAALKRYISTMVLVAKELKEPEKQTDVDVAELLKATYNELYALDGHQHTKLSVLATGLDTFSTDPFRLHTLCYNVLSNAIVFRKPNQPNTIQVNIHTTKTNCRLIVQDNGEGIPEEAQQKIFDMFYRGSEQSKGSGLGLYIVKRIVERNGGSIAAHSVFGQGTTVTINLLQAAPAG